MAYEHLRLVINYGWRKQILSAVTIAALVVMASTSFLGAQPDVNWNLTNTNDSQNSEIRLRTGLASQTDTAEDLPCQSYSADVCTNRTTGDVEAPNFCDTDPMVFRVGWDGILVLLGARAGALNSDCGRLFRGIPDRGRLVHRWSSTHRCRSGHRVGADNKGDFIIQYEPENLHCRDDGELVEWAPAIPTGYDTSTSGDAKLTGDLAP